MTIKQGHIEPYWNILDYCNLNYDRSTIDQTFLVNYIKSGHFEDQIRIYNFFENDGIPESALKIKSYFSELTPISVAINYMKPGTYLPAHSDLYQRWMEFFKLTDINRIHRIIVMLEDHKPGQFTEIEDKVINQWTAGDWFSWTGMTSHAVYNFSFYDRYALQITGYK
jgi:hypothetical protein